MWPRPMPAQPMPMQAMPAPIACAAAIVEAGSIIVRLLLYRLKCGPALVTGMDGVVEIEAGEDGEDIGLQRRDQELQSSQRDRREKWQERAEHPDRAEG